MRKIFYPHCLIFHAPALLLLLTLFGCTPQALEQSGFGSGRSEAVIAELEVADTPPPTAPASQADGVLRTEDSQESLPTPALIARAFERGEISDEERLLYLTYAVYEPDSLPAEYSSTVGWRGTMVVREIKELVNSPKLCDMDVFVRNELQRLNPGQGAACEP